MTNQNPAAPQPQSPNLERDILAKVNAHADRSLDRIFADIDGLLSGDLESNERSLTVDRSAQQSEQYSEPIRAEHYNRSLPPHSEPSTQSYPPQQSIDPPAATPQQKQSMPLWIKILLGIGASSIALGSGLLWLINERKIELPKNIDTSWLPFQSRSQVSAEDAKFAEYMRKSITKIESARTAVTSTPTQPNPATIADPIATNPTNTIVTAPATVAPSSIIKTPIALVKTILTRNRPSAVFQIDNQSQTVQIGQNIGTSNWSLLSVAKSEVIIKRKGGEIRSINVGQKFRL
jgi:hypothetical protein